LLGLRILEDEDDDEYEDDGYLRRETLMFT
jgi:hypothetical protein